MELDQRCNWRHVSDWKWVWAIRYEPMLRQLHALQQQQRDQGQHGKPPAVLRLAGAVLEPAYARHMQHDVRVRLDKLLHGDRKRRLPSVLEQQRMPGGACSLGVHVGCGQLLLHEREPAGVRHGAGQRGMHAGEHQHRREVPVVDWVQPAEWWWRRRRRRQRGVWQAMPGTSQCMHGGCRMQWRVGPAQGQSAGVCGPLRRLRAAVLPQQRVGKHAGAVREFDTVLLWMPARPGGHVPVSERFDLSMFECIVLQRH